MTEVQETRHIIVTRGLLPVSEPITLYEDKDARITHMKESFIKSDKTKHINPKFFSYKELKNIRLSTYNMSVVTRTRQTSLQRVSVTQYSKNMSTAWKYGSYKIYEQVTHTNMRGSFMLLQSFSLVLFFLSQCVFSTKIFSETT